MPPRDIAVASIYFSAKFNNEKLPDDPDGAPWWARLNGSTREDQPSYRCHGQIFIQKTHYRREIIPTSEVPEAAAKISIEQDYELKVIVQYTGHRQIGKKLRRKIMQMEQQTEMLKKNTAKKDDADEGEIDPEAGDDDSKLKAIANDPGTHEPRHENGLVNGFAAGDGKRKENANATGGSQAKRIKLENDQDESEEGEVEE